MFGKNEVAKNEIDGDGHSLRIVDGEPFYTIQGEGPFAGRPAVFIRLHGCPLRCFFCDTNFDSPQDPIVQTAAIVNMARRVQPNNFPKLAVITGGEPVRQNLMYLIPWLQAAGFQVQIETSGILWQDCLRSATVVCSPKTPVIHSMIQQYANEFKYVIRAGEVDPTDGLPVTSTQVAGGKPVRLARPEVAGIPISLSPMDEYDADRNKANLQCAAEQALKFGYRLGVQIHKLVGLP